MTADTPKSNNAISPAERRRAALIARIEEQIALATAQIEGKKPEFTRTKTVVDKTTGEKSKQTSAKNVRAWYWQQDSKYLLAVRYGLHTLQFAKGTNAIEAPNLKGIVTVLNTVKQAAQSGELDAAIAAVTSEREKKSRA